MTTRSYSLAIDIGGTFTDVVCAGGDEVHVFKVPSTRPDPSRAVAHALKRLFGEFRLSADAISRFCHGTTIATNGVLERKGARLGLITTEGFRDILELGRQLRNQMYDLRLQPEGPTWLAPGARRLEVVERISATGEIIVPLDEGSMREAVDRLLAEGVEAVAVCLLFGFLNPIHEQRIRDHIAMVAPEVPVSLSSDVDPEFREYERTVVTAFDAYVKPLVGRYLAAMEAALAADGVPAGLQVMQSRGGLASSQTARQRPVRLFLSGPAAGVLGASSTGSGAGFESIITIDVGGTSSDIALVEGGRIPVRGEMSVDGFHVRVPTVDVTTLGAGGGSIAWIDSASGLHVGPSSAGADPGPACYGRGGTDATVTDASLVLGYLDPDYFAGGRLKLDRRLAERVIDERVAGPLGMSRIEAALGIHRVANAQMADGIRLVSVKRGLDAREFALVSLGGAGGIHAAELARELEIDRIVVPRFPGVLSAAGLLAAPIEHELSGAMHINLADASIAAILSAFAELDRRVAAIMADENVDGLEYRCRHAVDMAYVGQSHLIEVDFDGEMPDPLQGLYHKFETAHERINGHATGAPAKIVNLRAIHQAQLTVIEFNNRLPEQPGQSCKGSRSIHLPEFGEVKAAVHDRDLVSIDDVIEGPAVLEQADTTTLVPPGWKTNVLEDGMLVLQRDARR